MSSQGFGLRTHAQRGARKSQNHVRQMLETVPADATLGRRARYGRVIGKPLSALLVQLASLALEELSPTPR